MGVTTTVEVTVSQRETDGVWVVKARGRAPNAKDGGLFEEPKMVEFSKDFLTQDGACRAAHFLLGACRKLGYLGDEVPEK